MHPASRYLVAEVPVARGKTAGSWFASLHVPECQSMTAAHIRYAERAAGGCNAGQGSDKDLDVQRIDSRQQGGAD